jgi:TPR repeat protein
MKTKLTVNIFVLCLVFGMWSNTEIADYAKGMAAANSKDYLSALREWRPLAEKGEANAQYSLGILYESGSGVPQDYKEAVRCERLAVPS